MAFNSFLFLLVFLPATVALYYLTALHRRPQVRILFLAVATLLFYANAAAKFLPLLILSVVLNFVFGHLIGRAEGARKGQLLTAGVLLNLGTLFYFKYTGFTLDNINLLFGASIDVPKIALPLGISFYTFQQIAFLVDASRGLVPTNKPATYAASILFFPFIISGPITLYREIAPQLEKAPERGAALGNILIGLVIFSLGMFKKTVIADSLILWVDPLFAHAAGGGHLGFLQAWGAATGYLLQMYFDFSGYSDMAIGIARMFGIILPLNFFSPIRCTSIIEWWRRWHMTLGRWVNAYIFTPIAIPLARVAATRRLGRKATLAVGTLVPTFTTMLVIGAWHGGNWTYFIFGALHGSYMVIAESWRFARRKKRKGKTPTRLHMAAGNILTLFAIFVAVVPFRADDVPTTLRIWEGMVGAQGLIGGMAVWPVLPPAGGIALALMLIAGYAFAYLMPNTEQFVSRFNPAMEWPKWEKLSPPVIRIEWRPTLGWTVWIGIILMLAAAFIARGSTSFVYFGF